MENKCCAANNEVMILACSGGSNVGQLSNRAAVELTQEGLGKMYCLAGIGGQLKGFVQSAKDVPVIAAIDGCAVGCAKAILKNAGIQNYNYIVLTDLGIEKNKNFNLSDDDVTRGQKRRCAPRATVNRPQVPRPAPRPRSWGAADEGAAKRIHLADALAGLVLVSFLFFRGRGQAAGPGSGPGFHPGAGQGDGHDGRPGGHRMRALQDDGSDPGKDGKEVPGKGSHRLHRCLEKPRSGVLGSASGPFQPRYSMMPTDARFPGMSVL